MPNVRYPAPEPRPAAQDSSPWLRARDFTARSLIDRARPLAPLSVPEHSPRSLTRTRPFCGEFVMGGLKRTCPESRHVPLKLRSPAPGDLEAAREGGPKAIIDPCPSIFEVSTEEKGCGGGPMPVATYTEWPATEMPPKLGCPSGI